MLDTCETAGAAMTSDQPANAVAVLDLPRPYLLFLGDTREAGYAKTAFGLRDWAPELCVGEFALPDDTVTTGLPRLWPEAAYARGARSLVIGVANSGGIILPGWVAGLVRGAGRRARHRQRHAYVCCRRCRPLRRAAERLRAPADRRSRAATSSRSPPDESAPASGC